MRCYACDVRLTDRESCTKFKISGEPTETCTKCLKTMDVEVIVPNREFDEEDEDEWQDG
jgi:hypothetical protein